MHRRQCHNRGPVKSLKKVFKRLATRILGNQDKAKLAFAARLRAAVAAHAELKDLVTVVRRGRAAAAPAHVAAVASV